MVIHLRTNQTNSEPSTILNSFGSFTYSATSSFYQYCLSCIQEANAYAARTLEPLSFIADFATDYFNDLVGMAKEALNFLARYFFSTRSLMLSAIRRGDDRELLELISLYPPLDPIRLEVFKEAYSHGLIDLGVVLYHLLPMEKTTLESVLMENPTNRELFLAKAIDEERGNILLGWNFADNKELFKEILELGITKESRFNLCVKALRKKEERELFFILFSDEIFDQDEISKIIKEGMSSLEIDAVCQLIDFFLYQNLDSCMTPAIECLLDLGLLGSIESLTKFSQVLLYQHKDEILTDLFKMIPQMASDCDLFTDLMMKYPQKHLLFGELFDEKTRIVATFINLLKLTHDEHAVIIDAALTTLSESKLLIDSLYKSSLDREDKIYLLKHPALQTKTLLQHLVFKSLEYHDVENFKMALIACIRNEHVHEIIEPVCRVLVANQRPDLIGTVAQLLNSPASSVTD